MRDRAKTTLTVPKIASCWARWDVLRKRNLRTQASLIGKLFLRIFIPAKLISQQQERSLGVEFSMSGRLQAIDVQHIVVLGNEGLVSGMVESGRSQDSVSGV